MKTFKQIKQLIAESGEHTYGGGFGQSFYHDGARSAIKDYGKGTFELGEDDNIDRVNAFLNAYFRRNFSDYQTQLGPLRTRLNMIGLDFEYDKNTKLEKGENKFELSRYGGTFGKSPTTPHDEFETTNGFPDGQSYTLVIDVSLNEKGLYTLEGKVVGKIDDNNGDDES